MQTQNSHLYEIVKKMMTPDKGILAADESNRTAGKRLDSIGLENTEENRQKYRDLLLSMPGIGEYLSGVILYDETIRQSALDGEAFIKKLENENIAIGIKVDTGAVDMPGFPDEKITTGLDTLKERLEEYKKMGAEFTKWRSVIRIDNEKGLPTKECIHTNCVDLARYARMVQDAGMVPMVEPEVLLEGSHNIEDAARVVGQTLSHLFYEMTRYRVDLGGVILKTSMVLPGSNSGEEMEKKKVAEMTVKTLLESVPSDIGGVVFLSGGQTPEQARDNLDGIADLEPLPFEIAFSYARAIQGPVLTAWQGKEENIVAARTEFMRWLIADTEADKGAL